MLPVVFIYLRLSDKGVKAVIDVALFITIFQQRLAVIFKFLGNIEFRIRKLFLGNVQENHIRRPSVDVLMSKTGAVVRRNPGGQNLVQVAAVEPRFAHRSHDFAGNDLLRPLTGRGRKKDGNKSRQFQYVQSGFHPNQAAIKLNILRSKPTVPIGQSPNCKYNNFFVHHSFRSI